MRRVLGRAVGSASYLVGCAVYLIATVMGAVLGYSVTGSAMAGLVVLLFVMVLGPIVLFAQRERRRQKLARAWGEAAGRLGLRHSSGSTTRYALGGEGAPARLTIESFPGDRTSRASRTLNIPDDIRIAPNAFLAGLAQLAGQRVDLQVGDPDFDRALLLEAKSAQSEAELIARLTASNRATLLRLFPLWGLELDVRRLSWSASRTLHSSSDIVAVVAALTEVAQALEPPAGFSLAAALQHNAASDPIPTVRLRNLRLLVTQFPDSPELAAASRAALSDPDATVRVSGALRSPAEGGRVIEADLLNAAVPVELLAQATAHVAATRPVQASLACFTALLDSPDEAHRCAALRQLVHLPDGGVRDLLLGRLEGARGATEAAIAEALGDLAETRAEPALIARLTEASPISRPAIVTALGKLGSAAAVEPLTRFGEKADGTLRTLIRSAVTSIQSRLTGAQPGQLSLTTGGEQSGAISMAVDEGALSVDLPDEKPASGVS